MCARWLLSLVLREESLGVERGPASGSCGGDGLAVSRVGDVSGGEHAGDVCRCGVGLRDDVSFGVELDLVVEEVGVGLVSDGEEESVDVDVEGLFLRGAQVSDEVRALQSVVGSEQSGGVGVV